MSARRAAPPERRPLHPGLHPWLAAAHLAAGCSSPVEAQRTAEIASVMARADMPLLRTRPSHMAGKYALMASDPYSFFRGTVPLYLHDFRNDRDGIGTSAFAADTPVVLSLGDAHLENFGSVRQRLLRHRERARRPRHRGPPVAERAGARGLVYLRDVRASDDRIVSVTGLVGYRVAPPLEAFLALTRQLAEPATRSALPGSDFWEGRVAARFLF